MRTDLTAAFIAAKNSDSRKPRQLLVFQFPVAGNVYISDQLITLGGITYQPLVESWGELTDASGSEDDFTAETTQLSLTLWNGGSKPFSDYFLQEDPEDVEVLCYQWFEGLADSDKALIDRFVVQDPISFGEASRLLSLDLVSVNMRYVGQVGATVTTALWPKALTEHVGKSIPLIFGSAGECATLCVKTAPQATLKGSIVKGSTTIECNESLAAFPAAGILQIEDEKIQYSSRTATVFTVQARGYKGTEPTSHPDNAEVHQLITDHTYLVGALPIQSISGVKVDGYPAPAGTYTINLTGTYGTIIFNQKPYSEQHAASAQSFELPGWEVAAGNTAWQAHYAIDQNKTSSSAMINEAYKTLSLQITNNMFFDMGLVVTAYLVVHHWETNVYTNDYCEVWVDGIGVVGRLARPSADDIFKIDAEVDVDHPHPYTDPGVGTMDPTHQHPTQSTRGLNVNGSPSASPWFGSSGSGGFDTGWRYFSFSGLESGASSSLFSFVAETVISGNAWVDFIEIDVGNGQIITLSNFGEDGPSGNYTIAGNTWDYPDGYTWTGYIKYRVAGGSTTGASISTRLTLPLLTYDKTVRQVETKNTGVNAYISQNGDVIPLLTDNRAIEILSQKSPSRTLIDKFDLSDFVQPSWSWFVGRRVQVIYRGTADDVNVFIPWITFEVEYRKKERVYSDKITATVVGSAANRPSEVISTLLAQAGLPASHIDAASFETVRSWQASHGYLIDGVSPGEWSFAEAIKAVCRQSRSRLYWNGGAAKLAVRKTAAEQSIVKYLVPADYQQQSIVAQRQAVQDLINSIELRYQLDRTADEPHYLARVNKEDSASIAAHGRRERPGDFEFDLVRSATMANNLAAYYLSVAAYPSTIYEFNTYLKQAEVEKEDVLALTSAGFHKMRKMPLRVKSVQRKFGSGKNKTINHLRLIAECLRYILIEKGLTDQVLVVDSLLVTIGRLVDLEDQIHAQDDLTCAETWVLAEEALLSDELSTIWACLHALAETVTVADSLSAAIGTLFEETITLRDDLGVWRGIGFGSQEFGRMGFGGVRTWGESNPDEVLFVDLLGVHMGSALTDTCTVADRMAASNGFGSAGVVADGFGYIPFGQ